MGFIEVERMLHTMEECGVVPVLKRVRQVLQELSLSGLELDAVFYKIVIVAYGSTRL
jgi:hypothetical protein